MIVFQISEASRESGLAPDQGKRCIFNGLAALERWCPIIHCTCYCVLNTRKPCVDAWHIRSQVINGCVWDLNRSKNLCLYEIESVYTRNQTDSMLDTFFGEHINHGILELSSHQVPEDEIGFGDDFGKDSNDLGCDSLKFVGLKKKF